MPWALSLDLQVRLEGDPGVGRHVLGDVAVRANEHIVPDGHAASARNQCATSGRLKVAGEVLEHRVCHAVVQQGAKRGVAREHVHGASAISLSMAPPRAGDRERMLPRSPGTSEHKKILSTAKQ